MKLLINDKELTNYLISLIDFYKDLQNIKLQEKNTSEAIAWACLKKGKTGYVPEKFNNKIKDKITYAVSSDLKEWIRSVKNHIKIKQDSLDKIIRSNLPIILEKFGEEYILEKYKKSEKNYFVKSVGLSLDKKSKLVRRVNFNSVDEDCLLRNTVGNENLLVQKIDQNKPFWFIDSGYTNFIEDNKKWHRLVRNHLHYSTYFNAPADRLQHFSKFPMPWRNSGDKILILEPGEFAASIFHVDVKKWKYEIVKELRQYTDKRIFFRPKINKKIRKDLYQKLMDDDYYCTISINSNSAVESIWAGIPAITLGKHISNPVTVNKLSDVNNLYTGPLGNWLCWLSYNQFTFDELVNGYAVSIVKKYHG
jgi:hypothetical protein